MRKIWITCLAAVPVFLLLLSGMADLHPVADSLAVFRAPLGGLSFLAGALLWPLWQRRYGAMAMALGLAAMLPVLWSMRGETGPLDGDFSLYQKNLMFRNGNLPALERDILQSAPDFITLQEVSRNNIGVLERLKPDYAAQQFCPFASVGGVAVLSRWPKIPESGTCAKGMAGMQVRTPQGPVWLVSLHLHWPYPHGQAAQVLALLPQLQALDGPVVLGGDFNMVPWSRTLTSIEKAIAGQRVGYTNTTFWLKGFYPLPIDHVLVPAPNAGSVQNRPLFGSDHAGVLAWFTLNRVKTGQ